MPIKATFTTRTQNLGTLDFNFLDIPGDTEKIDIDEVEKGNHKLVDL